MNAIILSIGDELVLGQTVDTNSAWLSQQLAAVGCDIGAHLTLPDDQKAIEQAIVESGAKCDFLIITGGLGPTEDDLTRQAIAAAFNIPLELNENWLRKLEAFFNALGRQMPISNRIQAMIPRGWKAIENTCGTAAGLQSNYVFVDSSKPKIGANLIPLKGVCSIYVMPGVPKEMKAMFNRDVLPHIAAKSGGTVILSRTLHTFGQGESTIAEKLGDLMNRTRNPSVGTTVANGIVSLRINSRFPNKQEARQQLDQTTQACEEKLGDIIFGQDDQTLPQIVADLLRSPPQHSALTVTTAESCTGGLLAKFLTDIPGSSAYFKQGWIIYSNKAKYERLGVSMEIINIHGAVSEPVVESMVKNARRLAKSDFALSISGIAGPDGGSPAKPVGTVCIALAFADPHSAPSTQHSALFSRTFHFTGDRETIRDRSAKMALTMLRFHLLGKPLPF